MTTSRERRNQFRLLQNLAKIQIKAEKPSKLRKISNHRNHTAAKHSHISHVYNHHHSGNPLLRFWNRPI